MYANIFSILEIQLSYFSIEKEVSVNVYVIMMLLLKLFFLNI